MKKVLAFLSLVASVAVLFSCQPKKADMGGAGKKQVAVIIKATDSEFWQSLNI
jgi:ABC-type sugar transport system substrate-binding protein